MADIKEEVLNSLNVIVRAAVPRWGRFSIAFGAERLALIPFRKPTATVLIAVGSRCWLFWGSNESGSMTRSASCSTRSTPAFKLFEQVSHDFPSSEYDVMIVVTGTSLLARESVERLRSLVTDVQPIEGTRGVLSMFSARQPAPGGGLPESVFPEPLPQGSAYHQLVERALNNDINHGRLLSADGRLALIILSLEPATVDGGHLVSIVNDVRHTMAEDLQGTGLTAELTAVPVM